MIRIWKIFLGESLTTRESLRESWMLQAERLVRENKEQWVPLLILVVLRVLARAHWMALYRFLSPRLRLHRPQAFCNLLPYLAAAS